MEISEIKGIEKINKYFYPQIRKMCSIAADDENIEKVVAFGPIVNHEDDIDDDTELFMAVYFKEVFIKGFEDQDYVIITADIEENLNMVWVCAPQNPRYDKSVSFKKDIGKGVVIFVRS